MDDIDRAIQLEEIRLNSPLEDDPLVQEENRSERLHKSQDRVLKDEEVRKRMAEYSKIDRLPYWLHPEADYMNDGSDSGITNGDKE